jgi:hypothetical protein
MTDEVDLVEADLEGLFVGVTGLTLARLIAMNAFDGIDSMNHCVTGMLIHNVSSFRCGAKCAVRLRRLAALGRGDEHGHAIQRP